MIILLSDSIARQDYLGNVGLLISSGQFNVSFVGKVLLVKLWISFKQFSDFGPTG
jgi:hypothetical protein